MCLNGAAVPPDADRSAWSSADWLGSQAESPEPAQFKPTDAARKTVAEQSPGGGKSLSGLLVQLSGMRVQLWAAEVQASMSGSGEGGCG